MRKFWEDVGIAFTMGMLVPAVLLGGVVSLAKLKREIYSLEEPIIISETATSPVLSAEEKRIEVVGQDGDILEIGLNAYLTGVLLAEMPASFHAEALKAQSVVARTYTVRAENGKSKHGDAAVCMKSNCCQAYIDEEDYLIAGGKAEDIYYIRQMVEATGNEVLTYDGDLIEATYFSCSGGYTEDAVAVWGTDVPYLQSVASPGEEKATYYTDTVSFDMNGFMEMLDISPTGPAESWVSDISYTDGGGVAAIEIGGKTFTGTQLRKLLNLRSTAFTIIPQDGKIVIHTRGYGHRVGMSQYGADAMAKAGSTYRQILAYYYQGTQLSQYAD